MLDANHLFGEKHHDGTCYLELLPSRLPCSVYIRVPAGCTALITRQGRLTHEVQEGGFMWLSPLSAVQYLVTNQHVTAFFPGEALVPGSRVGGFC